MTDERPDALLKSALEKIVYFEARSEQLHNDLEQARAEVARHKEELSHAAQREIELRRQLAEYEVNVARAHAEREEMSRANDALRGERASLIGKLVEASRLHEASHEAEDGFDLAAFISELRGEVLRSRDVAAAALAAAQPASSVHALRASAAMRAGAASSAGVFPVFSNGTLKARAKAAHGNVHSASTSASERIESAPLAETPAEPDVQVPTDLKEDVDSVHVSTDTSESVNDATARWAVALTPLPTVTAEVSEARPQATNPMPSGSVVSQQAERLKREGRLAVSAEELLALSGRPTSGRVEETLFEYTIRELTAGDTSIRLRAADRLKVLGNASAVPAIATALHSETEPSVLMSLLNTFAALSPKEGATAVVPQLDSPHSDVRLTALKALISLDPSISGPYLSQAMKDPDRAVRRRASLLALGLSGEAALKLGEQAMKDPNADVRRVAALVLGASGGKRARGLLQEALADNDAEVRKASAQALSRVLGKDVSAVVTLDDAQRRREIRRISSVPTKTIEAGDVRHALAAAMAAKRAEKAPGLQVPVVAVEAAQAPPPLAYAVVTQRPQALRAQVSSTPSFTPSMGRADVDTPEPVRANAAVLSSPPPPPPLAMPAPTHRPMPQVASPVHRTVDEQLCANIVSEIQCAIRGRTTTELLSLTQVDEPALAQALEQLVSRGDVVRRGMKFFVG